MKMTIAEFRNLKPKKTSKMRNVKTVYDGVQYDSKKEAARAAELDLLQKAKKISHLTRQVRFPIQIRGKIVCHYVADFTYSEHGKLVVEDVKSEYTKKLPMYRLKKKMMEAEYGISIRET